MPELPEVEALSRFLDASLRGRVIDSITLRSVAALKTFAPPVTALRGLTVSGCGRHGKFLDLSAPPLHLVVHLARAGWLRWREQPTKAQPALRGPLALIVSFAGGTTLEATEQGTDKRLAVYVVGEPSDVPGIARLGIDALDPQLTREHLAGLLRGSAGSIKRALADQALIAGIGNAYSDEILHAAKLSPFRKAASLDDSELDRLHTSLRAVLVDAVQRASALDVGELKSDKKMSMRVHGRTGAPCPVCGDTVREVSLHSRSFQYCPTCQTGGRVYADRRMSRLLR